MLKTCENCGEEVLYGSTSSLNHAIRNNKGCKNCVVELRAKKGVSNTNKSNFGNKNGMYGKSFYDIWVEKYGVDIANIKLQEHKIKLSKVTKGDQNGMYNKSPGIGSGNGISGWYKNWYFRSLNELSYMIYVIERFNLNWISAECKKYRVPYIDENNNQRTYVPDFIINDKYIIEIKPKALRSTKLNIIKFEAATQFYNDLKFKVTSSPRIIKKEELLELIENNKLKLTKKWEDRIKPL